MALSEPDQHHHRPCRARVHDVPSVRQHFERHGHYGSHIYYRGRDMVSRFSGHHSGDFVADIHFIPRADSGVRVCVALFDVRVGSDRNGTQKAEKKA